MQFIWTCPNFASLDIGKFIHKTHVTNQLFFLNAAYRLYLHVVVDEGVLSWFTCQLQIPAAFGSNVKFKMTQRRLCSRHGSQ